MEVKTEVLHSYICYVYVNKNTHSLVQYVAYLTVDETIKTLHNQCTFMNNRCTVKPHLGLLAVSHCSSNLVVAQVSML